MYMDKRQTLRSWVMTNTYLYPVSSLARTIQVFFGHTGLDMFHLRLADFQQLLSRDEATRLDGLLTLQKNSSGVSLALAGEF